MKRKAKPTKDERRKQNREREVRLLVVDNVMARMEQTATTQEPTQWKLPLKSGDSVVVSITYEKAAAAKE